MQDDPDLMLPEESAQPSLGGSEGASGGSGGSDQVEEDEEQASLFLT